MSVYVAGGTNTGAGGFSGTGGKIGSDVPEKSFARLASAGQSAAAAAPAAIGSAAHYVSAPSVMPSVASGGQAGLPDFYAMFDKLASNAAANSAQSQAWAREQMNWQAAQNAKAMEFEAEQARINREWSERLSNSAHVREVADLKAAGLNPVLSATGGSGAVTPSASSARGVSSSGARGDVDQSVNTALSSVFGAMLSAQTSLEAANINARTQESVAEKYTAMQYMVQSMIEAGLSSRQVNQFLYDENHPKSMVSAVASVMNKIADSVVNPPKQATSAKRSAEAFVEWLQKRR